MHSLSLLVLLLLLSSCSLDWTAGFLHFTGGNISSISTSARCSTLQDYLGTSDYCSAAAQFTSPTLSGSGTEADPYVLCSPYELNAIGTSAALINKSFRLDADLDMSCISGNHTPIASAAAGYSGVFDGNKKEIKNWKRQNAAEDSVGLFSYIDEAVVKDLTLTNATVQGNNYVGLLAGDNFGAFFLRIKTSGTVSGNTYVGGIVGREAISLSQSSSSATVSASSIAGGLVGGGGHIQIASSSFTGSVTVTSGTAGGLIGSTWGMIANSFSTGSVTGGADKIGGLVGTSSYHIHNSYSTGAVSGTTLVGGLIGSLTSAGSVILNSFSTSDVTGNGGSSANVGVLFGTNAGTVTNSYYYAGASCDADSSVAGVDACGTTATGSVAAVTDFHSKLNAPLSSWDFQGGSADGTDDFWEEKAGGLPIAWYDDPEAFTPSFSGAGTESSPYLITTEAEFNSIGMNPRLMESHYRLDADLDFTLTGFKQLGSEEAPFYASFDGNGKSLSNFTVSKNTAFAGAIGLMAFKEVRDLTVIGASVTGSTFIGAVVGYTFGSVTNCHSSGSVTGTYHVGGLVGLNVGAVTGSSSSATLSTVSGSSLGGLVGNNYGTITKSFATGNISNANAHSGGFVGTNSGTIEDSYSTGNVDTIAGFRTNFGGFVGNLSGTGKITNSYSTGNVSHSGGNGYVGGFVGNNGASTEIVNCFSTGNVTNNGAAAKTGPLVGNSLLTITNSYSLATASCDSGDAAGVQACNALGTGTIALLTDLHNTSTAPLDQWDFVTIWDSDGASLPTLR